MKILALEPYNGGSHRAFLEGWSDVSNHQWTILGLPPRKWKWRMRHAAITLADEVSKLVRDGQSWDILFCSDMLNLAEFRGLSESSISTLPSVVYFHENQLTYPVQVEQERDFHFGLTNLTTALAADQVWFNSAYHRSSFLDALRSVLRKMPDYQCLDKVESVRNKSLVKPQGIDRMPERAAQREGPPRILWAARWEHDKNPQLFFDALHDLRNSGIDFQVSVIGQQFDHVPDVFTTAQIELADRIDHWGFQETRDDYVAALLDADIVVSTADHEFFGVSIVEAVSAGAHPMLPNRLAYPEILCLGKIDGAEGFFYDGTKNDLVHCLKALLSKVESGTLWENDPLFGRRIVETFHWDMLGPRLDNALQQVKK
ncbi:MAG: DUF3524 domain-containing protein [Candidatus Zixiibacteriota bacterium]|nr:MAG: DUF3524 domain-containing protein [candidate division Zixibacteria bacterium]